MIYKEQDIRRHKAHTQRKGKFIVHFDQKTFSGDTAYFAYSEQ
jgi:hypothetical protein